MRIADLPMCYAKHNKSTRNFALLSNPKERRHPKEVPTRIDHNNLIPSGAKEAKTRRVKAEAKVKAKAREKARVTMVARIIGDLCKRNNSHKGKRTLPQPIFQSFADMASIAPESLMEHV